MRSHLLVLASGLALAGCGRSGFTFLDELPAASFDTPAEASTWASSSAPNLLALSLAPYLAAQLSGEMDGCPQMSVEGTTTTYTGGGCRDGDGRTWTGSIILEESDNGGSYIYDGLHLEGPRDCMGTSYPTEQSYSGTITFSGQLMRSFDVEFEQTASGVRSTDCSPLDVRFGIDYTGTVEDVGADADADGEPDDTLYNGEGRYGVLDSGVVNARTDDELVSNATCSDEAASGSTTVSAGGHAAVFTYDGATDCDMESTVTWTFDGADQGELAGVECSASRSGGASGLLWLLAIVGLATRRRRA